MIVTRPVANVMWWKSPIASFDVADPEDLGRALAEISQLPARRTDPVDMERLHRELDEELMADRYLALMRLRFN